MVECPLDYRRCEEGRRVGEFVGVRRQHEDGVIMACYRSATAGRDGGVESAASVNKVVFYVRPVSVCEWS